MRTSRIARNNGLTWDLRILRTNGRTRRAILIGGISAQRLEWNRIGPRDRLASSFSIGRTSYLVRVEAEVVPSQMTS